MPKNPELEKYLNRQRQIWKNRRRLTYIIDRRFSQYATELCLYRRFYKVIKALLRRKKRKIRVLDLGAGYGFFLRDLNRLFGDSVEAEGIGIYNGDYDGIAEGVSVNKKRGNSPVIYDISFEEFEPEKNKKYDFIVSVFGAVYYAKDLYGSLRKICDILDEGGIAIANYSVPLSFFLPNKKDYIRRVNISDHNIDIFLNNPPDNFYRRGFGPPINIYHSFNAYEQLYDAIGVSESDFKIIVRLRPTLFLSHGNGLSMDLRNGQNDFRYYATILIYKKEKKKRKK